MKIIKEKYGLDKHLKRFGTEEQCIAYLVEVKWDGRPQCPQCGNKHLNYFLTTRNIWKCSSCKKQFSAKRDTIFSDSKLPLTTWFKALYFFTSNKRGISSYQLGKLLGIEQRTAWFVLHRLRAAISSENEVVLSGIVEVDEKYIAPDTSKNTRLQRKKKKHEEEQEKIHGPSQRKQRRLRGYPLQSGGQKGKRKKSSEKEERVPYFQPMVLLGMVERDGRAVIKVLGKGEQARKKENVYPIMRKYISSSSFIYTDETNLYDGIGTEYEARETVNHKQKEYVRGDVHTNTVDGIWSHWDRLISGTYFSLDIHHLQNYATEHAFRWSIRKLSEREKIDTFLSNVQGKRIKYHELIIPKSAA